LAPNTINLPPLFLYTVSKGWIWDMPKRVE
jgi:hypothetical protein